MDTFGLDIVNMSTDEIAAILKKIDRFGYELISINYDAFPFGPFRMSFSLGSDTVMYYVSQKDLALEWDPIQYLNWIREASDLNVNWVSCERVPWWKIFPMLEERKDSLWTCENSVFFIPPSRSHPSWEYFNYFWSQCHSDAPLDIGWS
ncbi:E4.1 [Lizard adenovirus 2]|uniref:E4.1 n=1 Tax=Lizard adenovirus 2 TaxID=874272 RepID=A0A076FTC2_9ADEN|nr:E4.1 [Lizard adenovirus 2]AII22583.1 E4.1 [Lizard adenovirus 2]